MHAGNQWIIKVCVICKVSIIQDKSEVMIKRQQREGRASKDKNHTTLTKAPACQWKNNYGLNYG